MSKLNTKDMDFERLARLTEKFTPADIELLAQTVAQQSFEEEYNLKKEFFVTMLALEEAIKKMQPSLTDVVLKAFHEDVERYSRY